MGRKKKTTNVSNVQTHDLKGNTNLSHAHIRYCFTLHDYTAEDINNLKSLSIGDCAKFRYCIFAEELGESGETPHLQGYFELFKRKRWNELGLREQYHFQVTKGTREQNIAYIGKEHGNIFVNGIYVRRKEYLKLRDLYDWQAEIVNMCCEPDEWDDRSIYWYWEDKGCRGKTKLANFIVKNFNAMVVSGATENIFNGVINWYKNLGMWPDIIIIDIPRSYDIGYLNYTAIEKLKDGLFFSGKYESGMVDMPEPLVIVFSNEHPEFSKMSSDRWVIKKL